MLHSTPSTMTRADLITVMIANYHYHEMVSVDQEMTIVSGDFNDRRQLSSLTLSVSSTKKHGQPR